MTILANLDASNNAVQFITTNDPQHYLSQNQDGLPPAWIDGTGGGYLWHWTGSAWQDTAAAQAWRAQQASDATAAAPTIAARKHAAAVALDVEGRVLATGHTMNELFVRLHYTAIKRVAAGSRTALETAFINAVDAADAETP